MGNVLLALVYATSIALILLVTAQTTKSEGFSGAIGGGAQASTKYLPGAEEILQRYTTWAAVIWMSSCLLWFLFSSHQAR